MADVDSYKEADLCRCPLSSRPNLEKGEDKPHTVECCLNRIAAGISILSMKGLRIEVPTQNEKGGR